MTGDTPNTVAEHLRVIRATIDRVDENICNLQVRAASIEENMAAMNRRLHQMERDVVHIKRQA
jgi:hypothetical protein